MPELRPLTKTQRLRYGAYAAAITVAVLMVLDGVITSMENDGVMDTHRADDQVSTLAGDPWMVRDGRYVLSPAATDSMVPMSFAVEKPERGFRAFLVGGSFMRGVPHDGAGTIRFWLYRELRRLFPTSAVEVINAGATSQNSHRVKEVAKHAAGYNPDALIIASCNNEGALPPGEVQKRLQRSGTFRLLKSWLREERSDRERPLHTPQDPDIDAVREAFRENLTTMVQVARQKNVPIFLSTLPLNLRYDGNTPGRPIEGREHPDQIQWAPCVARGHALYESGDYRDALRELSRCDEVEALRWLGLSRYALGDYDGARAVLMQYAEIEPRNRCRPSFQQVIREVAASLAVPLIDLEAIINERAPHGIPGPEQFASYCHLKWQAQAVVADAMLAALLKAGIHPDGARNTPKDEDRERVFQQYSKQPASASYYY